MKPLCRWLRVLLLAALLSASGVAAFAVEMFTQFGKEESSLGFEPRHITKRYYPGYRLPNGQRLPVQPPPGGHPWGWRGW